MDRDELFLRDKIKKLLDVYTIQDLFEFNDVTPEDILIFLYFEYGLTLPEVEPV